ncbi:MAG TPA: ATP-binding domain-containing protein [Acholeplasmataceae bacterium]|nr:ATP-binding domain-containing protein [Acholeplasmataceae bacterium]
MLNKFIETYTDPYISDLKEFLLESDLAYFNDTNNLIVANLHKVKGMEFDNVYLLYEKSSWLTEEELRALYVGITRAKTNLSIHAKNKLFSSVKVDSLSNFDDDNEYDEPEVIEIDFDMRRVHLGYSEHVEENTNRLLPGYKLRLENNNMFYGDNIVGKLSKKAMETIEQRLEKNYEIIDIEVLNLVYWYSEDLKREVLVTLPKLKFKLKTI